MPAPTTGLGTHILDLSDERLAAGRTLRFAMFWPKRNAWRGCDFAIEIAA